jgi:hypothetical protein
MGQAFAEAAAKIAIADDFADGAIYQRASEAPIISVAGPAGGLDRTNGPSVMNSEAGGITPGYISESPIGEATVDGVTIDDVGLELGKAFQD